MPIRDETRIAGSELPQGKLDAEVGSSSL